MMLWNDGGWDGREIVFPPPATWTYTRVGRRNGGQVSLTVISDLSDMYIKKSNTTGQSIVALSVATQDGSLSYQ